MVMFPVVAVLMSVLFEDLELNFNILTGVALVLAGNVVVLGFWKRGSEMQLWLSKIRHYWFDRKVLAGDCADQVTHAQ